MLRLHFQKLPLCRHCFLVKKCCCSAAGGQNLRNSVVGLDHLSVCGCRQIYLFSESCIELVKKPKKRAVIICRIPPRSIINHCVVFCHLKSLQSQSHSVDLLPEATLPGSTVPGLNHYLRSLVNSFTSSFFLTCFVLLLAP